MAQAKKQPSVKPYDDPNIHEEEIEPVLAVKQTRVIWILVFAILWLSYQVGSFTAHVDNVISQQMSKAAYQLQVLSDIIDHEMDDTNDNYEASLAAILKNNCSLAAKRIETHKCKVPQSINEQFHESLLEQPTTGSSQHAQHDIQP